MAAPKGKIAVGDGLGRGHHVWLDAPKPRAGPCACASVGGDDLIGDQKDAVAVANFLHHRREGFVRRDHAACAKNRFHDHRGNGVRALEGDLVLQRLHAQLRQLFRVGLVERVAVGVRGRDVETAGQERFIGCAEIGVSVHRCATDVGAVIALSSG